MAKIWVLIDGQASNLGAALAAEALRRAAAESGREAVAAVRGTGDPAPAGTPAAGDRLLLVGDIEPPLILAGLPRTVASQAEALDNPAGLLRQAAESGAAAAPMPAPGGVEKNIVAVTSCPTGIAHTFMAAEGLQKAAEALGHTMRVETQGSVGAGTPLSAEEIAAADLVMIAADREVDRERFNGKRVYVSDTKRAITDGQNLIRQALAEAKSQRGEASAPTEAKKAGPYKHLMTGVSFMLPFVVAGGLCIALAFAMGGIKAEGSLAQTLMTIGGQGGFALMVPILAGYISFSIADRPGLAPGMIGGILCNILGAGFLGGIVAGFLAGYTTNWLNRLIVLPKNLAGLKPVLILPLLGTLITGLILYYVIGGPVAKLNAFLVIWLKGLGGASSLALGLLIGGMMALDMGGPVNKAAYAFSTGLLEAGVYLPMAAAMAAGMVPPLAAALSTRLFRNRYSAEEREAGRAAFVLGLAFISEGAIPFAARDPFRAIPAFVAGAALTGALSMVMGIKLMAPHGGVFVLLIPGAVSNVGAYALTIVAGAVVSALIMGLLKKPQTVEWNPAPPGSGRQQ